MCVSSVIQRGGRVHLRSIEGLLCSFVQAYAALFGRDRVRGVRLESVTNESRKAYQLLSVGQCPDIKHTSRILGLLHQGPWRGVDIDPVKPDLAQVKRNLP
jgi:hypothetical protein